MVRIDRLLVDKKYISSRNRAQQLIAAGRVSIKMGDQWTTPKKASQQYPHTVDIQIEQDDTDRFVSRGGIKLESALFHTEINVNGHTVLDIGQSTGGFTDCLLQAGAVKVIGIEVGHSQLAPLLQKDKRVVCFEDMNARNMPYDQLKTYTNGNGFDLIVMDVSFISQTKILPSLYALLTKGGDLISLVKPQFEVGPAGLGKGGIVKDETLYPKVKENIISQCHCIGLTVQDWFNSPIKGSNGNREFFLWAKKDSSI
ncbi:MAG: TlyA family RNA methyltransferase [Endozoicomonas sp. (ex Botrylloides leachii)]|nr:TlyA family RNA methyltransferase [Endozoicomonas sp. (ex Botrylloides leachii)]